MSLDRYTWTARLQPILLAAFPAAVLAFALGSSQVTLAHVGTSLAAFGVVGLLVGIARDRGKRLEPALWAAWGGPPTTTLLLSTSARPSSRLTDHRAHIRRLLPDAEQLTDELDLDRPEVAQRVIERYTAHLRERTRDRTKFPIVADTNAAYGFRRNTLGLRPLGLLVAAATVLVTTLLAGLRATASVEIGSMLGLAMAAVVAAVAAGLWARCGPDWVRTAADAYAAALLDAAESVGVIAAPQSA